MKKFIGNKYVIYTLLFWGGIATLIMYISSIGLCTLGTSDAVSQIYPIMFYVRRLLLNLFDGLMKHTEVAFPMFDYTIGMGDDVIIALNWHGLGDPFYIFSVLVSEKNLPYFCSWLFYFKV